jgi:hypothetical protein
MKLTRGQLREAINDVLISEGILDTAENWATTAFGHLGIGDIAAGLKAGTLDLARVTKDLSDLGDLLLPHGLTDVAFLGKKDDMIVQAVANSVRMSAPEMKEEIKDEINELGSSLKKMLISTVSMFPDVVISGPIAATITAIPVERLFIEAAPVFNNFMEKVRSFPGGESIQGLTSLFSKVAAGPAGFIFGDPVTAFTNLGILVDATSDTSNMMNLAQTGMGVGMQGAQSMMGLPAMGPPMMAQQAPPMLSLAESRLCKLAGLTRSDK